MLLKPRLHYWVFPVWINLLVSCTSHGEFFGKHCWVLFYKREYVLTALRSVYACLSGLKVHSVCSLWETEVGKKNNTKTLVWIKCLLGLVTVNVMYYQNNNDNKWSQHTRGQAYSQSIQTHTLCQMPKCCRPSPQVLSDLHLIYWSGQAPAQWYRPRGKERVSHSFPAPLPFICCSTGN